MGCFLCLAGGLLIARSSCVVGPESRAARHTDSSRRLLGVDLIRVLVSCQERDYFDLLADSTLTRSHHRASKSNLKSIQLLAII